MNVSELHRLARNLREVAVQAALNVDEQASPSQIGVIADISRNPGTTAQAVRSRTGFAQSQVSTTVNGLRQAGVIITEPHPDDARKTLLHIAPKYASLMGKRGALDVNRALKHRYPHLTKAQIDDTTKMLTIISDYLADGR